MSVENDNLKDRKDVIIGSMIIVFIVYVLQLINLQILNPEYKQHADSNAFLKKT